MLKKTESNIDRPTGPTRPAVADRIDTEAIRETLSGYARTISRFVEDTFVDSIRRVVHEIDAARTAGGTIYLAGNGGSASTASHWVNDLGKATKRPGRDPMRVMSLSDNVSWLTALGNDEGFERVFTGQLENFAKPGDVLIVISASGNSPNLVEAVSMARSRGVSTVALLGFDGGILKEMADEYLLVPTEKGAYGVVESAHGVLCHVVTTCLAKI
jgi:D-sedoheptulose 7-phosphate isomerase